MSKCFFYVFLLAIIFHPTWTDIGCNTHATILRQLEREGFHIDIHSLVELVVDIEKASQWENCSLVLRESIPDSFYVDPDQLFELKRTGILQACTTDTVNIETPQHLSKSHTVYVYGRFQRSQNLIYSHLKFPLHLRYQEPKIGGGYSTAVLKSPHLMIRCKDSIGCKNIVKSKAPCFFCNHSNCSWMRFPYKTNSHNFTVSVPVGDLNHLPFVTVVTYLLTYGGGFYVLSSLANYN